MNYFGLKNKAKQEELAQQQPADNAMQQPQQQAQPQQYQQPQIDTNDPINSLASQLVTPEEREAQEQKMLKNKRRMIAWTGLFDGLRNLANLYAVSRGAAPMKFTDNPHQQLDQSYQEEKQRQEGIYQNRDKYAKSLYDFYRQGQQDKIKEESHKAQMEWYKDRSEIAQKNAELNRLKSVRVIKNKDGSLMKFDPINGTIEPLSEADPLYVEYMQGRIAQQNKKTGLLGAPKTTTRTNAKGETTTSVTSYGTGSGNKGGGTKKNYSQYKKGSSGKDKYAKYKKNK